MQSTASPVVLCIDDEELILTLLQDVLAHHGYRCLAAATVHEALRLLGEHPIDGIILDYSMPDMEGDVIASKVRAFNPLIPIVLFSGSLDIPPSALLLVDAFVAKGEGMGRLLSVLGGLLKASSGAVPKFRRFPRFSARLPLAVTVDHAGRLEMLQGISTDLGEGGIGGVIIGDLEPGEYVRLTICDSRLEPRLEPRAQIRHREGHAYGFQFVDVSAGDRNALLQLCGL